MSSVQVLRVVGLAYSHGKSYIFSVRPCQFPATTLYFSIVVSLPQCHDDLHVLTLVHDSEVLEFEFHEEQALLRIGKYSLNSMSCHLPLKRHSRTLCISGPFTEALSISRVAKATWVDSWAIHFSYSSVWFFFFDFDVGCNKRDKESAMFLGPGMYLTENV